MALLSCLVTITTAGCIDSSADPGSTADSGRLEKVYGSAGAREGYFKKPRAIAIDDQDRLYIVDMTARIQVFDRDGSFLRSWRTPNSTNGRPCGLSIERGRLLVADTHYNQILAYDLEGTLLKEESFGDKAGIGPGEFAFVTDVVRDSQGNYYVSEFGDADRIQKFSPERKFIMQWGGHGEALGHFSRPQSLAIDEQDQVWVADSCNHRIQVFDASGSEAKLIQSWGERGSGPGQLYYPYSIVLDRKGAVYLCEYGNHRIQKFTREGKSLGVWGGEGREEGKLFNPWALALDSRGRLHVLDSHNHRVQRVAW
jgi:sugar lactone lactonase YvrE